MYVCFYKEGKKSFYELKKSVKVLKDVGKLPFFEKKVLVISSKDTYYYKDTLPKTSKDNIKSIIQNQVEDTYPDQEMDFCFNIAKSYENTIQVNVFVFKKSILDDVKKDFDFNYVLAEPLCFKSQKNEVLIYKEDTIYNILALTQNGLYAYLQLKDFSKDYFELFLKGLGNFEIEDITSYEDIEFGLHANTTKKSYKNYPIFLDYIANIDLKDYKRFQAFKIDEDLVFRVVMYFLIGYAAALYVNGKYYEENIKKIEYLNKKLLPYIKSTIAQNAEPKTNYKEAFVKEYKSTVVYIDPIFLLDDIASHLEDKEYITNIDIKPLNPQTPKVSFTVNTQEPFKFLESLTKDKCIKDFDLESPVSQNFQKVYSLNIRADFSCVR
ncbi:MAG: hypothetical protein C0170_06840 [Hydrogenobaculum sp.]|nr:MAG: hypothetical protein C0170_06840 [Hydrogenobaculum sp.]HEK24935.1 hypothetical protein [Hydrogenobaculum sp.]